MAFCKAGPGLVLLASEAAGEAAGHAPVVAALSPPTAGSHPPLYSLAQGRAQGSLP